MGPEEIKKGFVEIVGFENVWKTFRRRPKV